MNFLENITFRRTRTKSESNVANENNSIILTETTIDGSTSLPELSDDENQEFSIKEQLAKLTLELQYARKEIDTLSNENNDLKK